MKKLEQLLALARERDATTNDPLATAVIDLLGEAQDCGVDELLVRNNGVAIPATWARTWMSPDETRAMGRMLFVGADEADLK